MSAYEWANLCIQALTLFVLGWTLYWVREYTKATRDYTKVTDRIAESAAAQAEAVFQPVIVVFSVQDHSDHAILDGADALPVLPVKDTETRIPLNNIQLRNVGAGPALALAYQIHNPGNTRFQMERSKFVLARDEGLDTAFSRNWLLDEAEIVIHYESASGARYQTHAHFNIQLREHGLAAQRIANQAVRRLVGDDKGSWRPLA